MNRYNRQADLNTARTRKAVAGGASTLYPTADVEYAVGAATPFTRYPHMDVKVVGAAKQFLHRDHLASVRLVTDASGNVVEGTGYAAYGERLNAAMQTQKGYIGERHDPETGLLYLNARYQDPFSAASSAPTTGTRHCRPSAPTATPTPSTIRSTKRIRMGI